LNFYTCIMPLLPQSKPDGKELFVSMLEDEIDVPYIKLKKLCGRNVFNHLQFRRGDISGFFQLGFDNIATVISLSYLLESMNILEKKEVYEGFLPGLAMTMVFGNLWYSWMGCRLGAVEGRHDVTAQPYGLNTPAAFAYLYAIMLPVSLGLVCQESLTDAECRAWKSEETLQIATAATFLQGLIAAILGLVGPLIMKVCPVAALVSALGGIGITALGVGQMLYDYDQPVVGLLPMMLMVCLYFGNIKTKIPGALIVALSGSVLAWLDGVTDTDVVNDATEHIGAKRPQFYLIQIFDKFGDLGDYMGTIVPIAIAAAASTLMVWQTAKKNGDQYPLMETMVVDGIGSMIAACFGCPFGTSVYIGHTAYQKVGAGTGYSIMNACTFMILGFFGLFGLVQAIVPMTAVAPLITFVGIVTCVDAIEEIPLRHIPAVILGLMPSIGEWALNQCSMETSTGETCTVNTAPVHDGLVAFKSGSLLVSMCLSAITALVSDRNFLRSAAWAMVTAIFALFGFIHAPSVSTNFDDKTSQSQWRFGVAYMELFGLFLILYILQYFGKIEKAVSINSRTSLSIGHCVRLVQDDSGVHPKLSTSGMKIMNTIEPYGGMMK